LTTEDLKYLNGSPDSYNLTPDSSFIDIGSGFGKPVFHAALYMGKLINIKVVEAKVLRLFLVEFSTVTIFTGDYERRMNHWFKKKKFRYQTL